MVCPGFLYLELHGGSCTVVQNSLGRLHFMVFDGNNAARQKSSWSRTCPTVCNLLCHKEHRNPLEFHKASAPEPSGTSQGICTGTLRDLTKHLLRQSHPEPHDVFARNPPEPHHASSPSPSGTSPGTCTKTL